MSETLKLIETAISWQGEGKFQGELCTFLRVKKCNLRCKFCFGIVNGRRIPRLASSNGKGNIKINEAKIGDKIYTFDDNQNLVETEIVNTIQREVTKYYEIKINGTIYYVTPEHPFFTTRGLVETQNLKVGDKITNNENFDMVVKDIKYINTEQIDEKPLTVYNITCSPYNTYLIDNMWVHNCDTLNRMDNLPEIEYTYESLYKMIRKGNNNLLITGGEPTLYNEEIVNFLKYIAKCSEEDNISIKTNFETNGYKLVELDKMIKELNWKDYNKCYYDLSPKNIHMEKYRNEMMDIIRQMHHLDPHFYIKLVGYDYNEKHKHLIKTLELIRSEFPDLCIYLMPEGAISTELLFNTRPLLEIADKYNCNFSSRLHIVHNFY